MPSYFAETCNKLGPVINGHVPGTQILRIVSTPTIDPGLPTPPYLPNTAP